MFVIMNDKNEFYAIDYQSGGYAYFTNFLKNAAFFSSYENAKERLKNMDFTKEAVMKNGVKYPPRLINECLGLNDKKLKGKCKIKIVEIKFETLFEQEFFGEIKKPK